MNSRLVYDELTAHLRPLGRRLRVRAGVELLLRMAWVPFGACAMVLIAGRLFPIDGYRLAASGLPAIALLAWLVYSLTRPIPPMAVARRADRELDLRDRLGTALSLADYSQGRLLAFDPLLIARQLDDALTTVQAIDVRSAFPIRIERAWLVRAAAPLAVSVALLVLPNPMDAIIAQRAQVAQTAQEQAAQLEKLAQEVQQNPSLSPEDRNELLRQMRELIAQLRSNPGDAKKALADLAKFQEQLRTRLDPAAMSEQAALDALARQLAQIAGSQDKPQDAAELAELLEQLAAQLDQLSPEERAALAGALERAAGQTAAGDPDLASALAAMAQAARAGTSDARAQRATRQASQALQDAARRQALQQSLAQALNQADATQRALAQANGGSGQGEAQTQGQGQTFGQGNQPGGQSQGGQGTQPGGGGGTTAKTLPPGVRQGTAGAPTGPNKTFGVGDLETVFAPAATGQGREEFVLGQQGQQGETTTREDKSPQPGVNNPALVPYNQVYQRYAEIAGQAMERSYIPSGLQDYVKEYFSGLEP